MDIISEDLKKIIEIYNSGKLSLAFEKIENLLKTNNNNLDIMYTHGQLALKNNKVEKALSSFQKVLEKKPNDINLLNIISSIHMIHGNFKEAEKFINNVIKIDKKI